MHDVAAFLVRRDHRLARDLRDILAIDFPFQSVEELASVRPADDRSGDSARTRRLGGLKVALDAALADWADDRRPAIPAPTTSTGTTPTTSVSRTRTAVPTRRVEGGRGSSLGRA